jgi:predicted nucleic acid-binding protein
VTVILDTSIWVDAERGRLAPADVAAVTGEEPVYLAPPVIAELQYESEPSVEEDDMAQLFALQTHKALPRRRDAAAVP